MRAPSMQRLSQMLSSSLLVLLGGAVAVTSLTSVHAKQTFAFQGKSSLHSPDQSASHRLGQLLDRELPGSLPYAFDRGIDRVQILLEKPENHLPLFLELSRERAHAARVAGELQNDSKALVTLSKAVAYYHRALEQCHDQTTCGDHQMLFEETKMDLLDTSGTLMGRCSDAALRAKFQRLSGELETLPEPTFSR